MANVVESHNHVADFKGERSQLRSGLGTTARTDRFKPLGIILLGHLQFAGQSYQATKVPLDGGHGGGHIFAQAEPE